MEIPATNYTTVKDPKINSLIIWQDAAPGAPAALAVPLTFSSATLEVQAHKIMRNMQRGKKIRMETIAEATGQCATLCQREVVVGECEQASSPSVSGEMQTYNLWPTGWEKETRSQSRSWSHSPNLWHGQRLCSVWQWQQRVAE